MSKLVPRGIYAITDSTLITPEELVVSVAQAIAGGVSMIQYRDKGADHGRRRWEVQDLLTLCRPLGVPLIINDDVALAAEVGAAGVHLGRDDGDIASAREVLGAGAIIGVSCYNDLERAIAAERAGADYVAFGRFFSSSSKPYASPAELTTLQQAKAQITIPVVAIGGITPQNGAQLVAAGADLLAVIHALFGQVDIKAAAERLCNLYR